MWRVLWGNNSLSARDLIPVQLRSSGKRGRASPGPPEVSKDMMLATLTKGDFWCCLSCLPLTSFVELLSVLRRCQSKL